MLRIRFVPNTQTYAITAVFLAFRLWDLTTRFTFTRVADNATSDIVIGFFSGNHGDGAPFDGNGGVLISPCLMEGFIMMYVAGENWVNGAVQGGFDLQTVVLHEIGHLLGLGHSQDSSAIMYPSLAPGQVKSLGIDDVRGVLALYS
ncbi:metalloendoproteinase 1-MMP-like [Andrographis paniculata]|uniref:metalloendoproteinase 1-MMP-like n=1 Tax=Andrographis paniculata TaxID=175694 RepID=UPI0021E94248|nr:metalloendoproteinase 1-MMP-like [Andrographis paniculata]